MSTRNKIADLNNHLFLQIERLNDDNLKGDELQAEIQRSKAMAQIATQIVQTAKVAVDAMKVLERGGLTKDDLPGMFKQIEQ